MQFAPPVARYRRGVNNRSYRSSGARGGVPCRIDSGTEAIGLLRAIAAGVPNGERPSGEGNPSPRIADAHRRPPGGPPNAAVVLVQCERHVVLHENRALRIHKRRIAPPTPAREHALAGDRYRCLTAERSDVRTSGRDSQGADDMAGLTVCQPFRRDPRSSSGYCPR